MAFSHHWLGFGSGVQPALVVSLRRSAKLQAQRRKERRWKGIQPSCVAAVIPEEAFSHCFTVRLSFIGSKHSALPQCGNDSSVGVGVQPNCIAAVIQMGKERHSATYRSCFAAFVCEAASQHWFHYQRHSATKKLLRSTEIEAALQHTYM